MSKEVFARVRSIAQNKDPSVVYKQGMELILSEPASRLDIARAGTVISSLKKVFIRHGAPDQFDVLLDTIKTSSEASYNFQHAAHEAALKPKDARAQVSMNTIATLLRAGMITRLDNE